MAEPKEVRREQLPLPVPNSPNFIYNSIESNFPLTNIQQTNNLF